MGRVVAVVVLLLAVSASAWAAPSLFGPTGLILTPTADTLGVAGINAQGAWISGDNDTHETIVAANLGVLPQLEVGAAWDKIEDGPDEVILNAKLKVAEPPLTKTRIAVGVIDLTDEINSSPYAVLSHTIGLGYIQGTTISNPEVHVGVGGGFFDGLFAGLNVTVASNITLMAEFDSENWNFGARFPLATGLDITVAGLDTFDDFAIAASYQFR